MRYSNKAVTSTTLIEHSTETQTISVMNKSTNRCIICSMKFINLYTKFNSTACVWTLHKLWVLMQTSATKNTTILNKLLWTINSSTNYCKGNLLHGSLFTCTVTYSHLHTNSIYIHDCLLPLCFRRRARKSRPLNDSL